MALHRLISPRCMVVWHDDWERILIVEGNTQEIISSRCMPAGHYFVNAFAELDQPIEYNVASPYPIPMQVNELEKVDSVVFLGSGVEWSFEAIEATPSRYAMNHAFGDGLPLCGSCNGGQPVAVLLRLAKDVPQSRQQIDLSKPICKTENGKVCLAFEGRKDIYVLQFKHREEIESFCIMFCFWLKTIIYRYKPLLIVGTAWAFGANNIILNVPCYLSHKN